LRTIEYVTQDRLQILCAIFPNAFQNSNLKESSIYRYFNPSHFALNMSVEISEQPQTQPGICAP